MKHFLKVTINVYLQHFKCCTLTDGLILFLLKCIENRFYMLMMLFISLFL